MLGFFTVVKSSPAFGGQIQSSLKEMNNGTLKPKKHVLVIGGTGMLKEASKELARKGNIVTVVARNLERLKGLEEETKKCPEK